MEQGRIFNIKYKTTGCLHKQIELDQDCRSVKCLQCNLIIDPFDVLMNYAFQEPIAKKKIATKKTKK